MNSSLQKEKIEETIEKRIFSLFLKEKKEKEEEIKCSCNIVTYKRQTHFKKEEIYYTTTLETRENREDICWKSWYHSNRSSPTETFLEYLIKRLS